MKIYIVVGGDYVGDSPENVFLNKEDAEHNVRIRNKFKRISDTHRTYRVVEKDVLETRLDEQLNMLAVKISGYVVFDGTQEAPEISTVVAEEWCKGKFDDIGDFISVDLYIKSNVDDFDLSREELTDKYGYVWEDILNMSALMKNKGIELEDIAQAIEDKYKISWE